MGKPLIGSRKFALDAVRVAASVRPENGSINDWRMLTGGSMRTVLLHKPTQVVYKLDGGWDEEYGNMSEYRNATALRRMALKHVYVPKTSAFRVNGQTVLAMEYIIGTLGSGMPRDHNMPARQELFHKGHFNDMHGDNFIWMPSGQIAPIDMGSLRNAEPDDRVLSCGDGSVWGASDCF